MKCATVIGGRGFIGRALVHHLRETGWQCWVPERDCSWPVQERELGHVFYCAGLTADFLQRPVDAVEAHVSLLSRVLQSPSYTSLIYLSSTRLYDGLAAGTLAHESDLLSVAPSNPRHFYDLTKLTGESICHVMGQGRARIARLSCVYDLGNAVGGFLPTLLDQVAQLPPGGVLTVESSPGRARDYVFIGDVLRALVAMALGGEHTTYNVASGCNLRNEELAQWISRESGRQLRFTTDERAPAPPAIDTSLLRQEFGWEAASVLTQIRPFLASLPR